MKRRKKSGQAMLVAILIIFGVAIAIALAVAEVALSQNQATANLKLSDQAYNFTAGCMDNALMQITRGNFTNPAPLSEGGSSCTINISGSGLVYQILVVSEITSPFGTNKITKKIQADINIAGGITTITSYKEIN